VDARTWSREQIEELVRGRTVVLRNAAAAVHLPVPGWLAAAAGHVSTQTTGERVAATHPDDRDTLVQCFIAARAAPGATATMTYRVNVDGIWTVYQLENVNLLDTEGVEGMLSVIHTDGTTAGPVELADPALFVGEHDFANWTFVSLDAAGNILSVEGKCRAVLGFGADQLVGRSLFEFLQPEAIDDSLTMWAGLVTDRGSTRSSRKYYRRPDGNKIWVETAYLNRFDAEGNGDVLGLIYDISERRAAEEALQRSHEDNRRLLEEFRLLAEEFRLLAEEVPAAVFKADHAGRIIFHNERWRELCLDEGSAQNLREIAHVDDRPAVDLLISELSAAPAGASRRIEVWSSDRRQTLALVCRSVHDSGSRRRSLVGSVDDVTDAAVLRQRADHDGLTGLLNRRAMDELLAEAIAGGRDCLVVFIDLDGFKGVNDTHGHEAGDEVLRVLSGRLQRALRTHDAVARYGGDEFVVLCHASGEAGEAASIRDRIAEVTREPIRFATGSWQPSGSIGIACPQIGDDVTSLVRRADLAMFAIKQDRRLQR
jgi:diguanylate cyclase (GGDEF)-like protein/PAS domain S-box-containing protein